MRHSYSTSLLLSAFLFCLVNCYALPLSDGEVECLSWDIKWEGNDLCRCPDNKWDCVKDAGPPCKEGDTKRLDCNTCSCDKNGLWMCTLMGCRPIPHITNEEEGKCQPGETKEAADHCNSCTCTEEGAWACTQAYCDVQEIGETPRGKRDAESACENFDTKWEGNDFCACAEGTWSCQERGPPCKAGETKMEDCNNCFCSENGLWQCTKKGCGAFHQINRERRETEESACENFDTKWEGNDFCACNEGAWSCQELGPPCKAGETKMEDCNHCFCSENGLWGCTLMGCGKYNANIRERRETAESVCKNFDTKWEGNDFCACDEGSWSCQELGPPCKAGETKMEDCNHCFCSENGLWGCTLMGCGKYNANIRERRETADPPCQAGETKMEDCNRCFCSKNGRWGCTHMGCTTYNLTNLNTRERRETADNKCTNLETKWEGNHFCVCHEGDWSCEELGPQCTAGDTKMQDCNRCFCTENGLWGCTRIGCGTYNGMLRERRATPENKCTNWDTKWEGNDFCVCREGDWSCEELGPPCKAGDTKMEDCNHCVCSGNGLWGCTLMGCRAHNLTNLTIRERRETAEECVDGKTKFDGNIFCKCSSNQWNCTVAGKPCPTNPTKWEVCNKVNNCTCIDIGLHSCHKKDCPHLNIARGPCMPGETKNEDCNRCFCTKNNVWICSREDCETSKKSRREVVPVLTDLGNTPCAPDDYFKVDCNTCYCNIERTGYLCTQNICSPPAGNETASNNSTASVPVESSSPGVTLSEVGTPSQLEGSSEVPQSINANNNPAEDVQTSPSTKIIAQTPSLEVEDTEDNESSAVEKPSKALKQDDVNIEQPSNAGIANEGSGAFNERRDQNEANVLRFHIPLSEDIGQDDISDSSDIQESTTPEASSTTEARNL